MTLRVLYFGSYDRGVGRNAILIAGLREAGVHVEECHVPMWRDTRDKLSAVGGVRGRIGAAGRMVGAWSRLIGAYRAITDYDVMIVGSTAHLDLPLARILSRRRGCPLVFDPLVSISETVRDRDLLPVGSLRLRALTFAERWLFRLPDLVLTDTSIHAEELAQEIGLDRRRAITVPAGAPSIYHELATPYEPGPVGQPVRVLYFGQYIPLHGLEVVLRAAARLAPREDIVFELIGVGQTLDATKALAVELGLPNVRFVEEWLPADRLAVEHIAHADICLGIFGTQPKAQCVVPFKVYTGLASGRAVVTAETYAIRQLMVPGEVAFGVRPGDDEGLARKISTLADDRAARARIAARGRKAYEKRFKPRTIGLALKWDLKELVGERRDTGEIICGLVSRGRQD